MPVEAVRVVEAVETVGMSCVRGVVAVGIR